MIGRLRLISGLILTAFVVGHFINHSLGIISLKAMNDALKYFIQPWRDPVGEALLIAALLVHASLALVALYQRRTLAMGWGNAAQMVSGFLIPVLLGAHVLATRGVHEVFGVVEGYQFTLYGMWVPSIFYGVLNVVALPVVWFHTCLGWHYWLRLKPWYSKVRIWLLGVALVLPTLALAGFASASLRVSRLSNSERWTERLFARTQDKMQDILEYVATGEFIIWVGVPLTIAATLFFRLIRNWRSQSGTKMKVHYADLDLKRKQEFSLLPGVSLLEQIKVAEIPHASVCGGRGRCSTCRVRIESGLENLEPASADERRVLARINASADVRLACQIAPKGPLSVTALLSPDAGVQNVNQSDKIRGGDEQDIAGLFADIRGFTQHSETKLPFDTAFLLNRYFAAMGRAIEDSGGHLDKFIGDGVMALFGVDGNLEEGCQKALLAASRMSEQLERLNDVMKDELPHELRIGIGIHCGTAIVGHMGYNKASGLTAIGDVVNTASRLESMTKEFGVQLIASREVLDTANALRGNSKVEKVSIRGREEQLSIAAFPSAQDVPLLTPA